MDDAELVRQARTCIYGTKQTDALLVEMADRIGALVKERDKARAQLAAAISRAEYHADRNTTAADVFRDISALARTKGTDHE